MAVNAFPRVSIITPAYNGAEYLEELIQSVLKQDYPNIEHIIVDDGSQDNGATISILQKYPHLHWWSRPNQGQYATMNEGLLAAQGEIVCFVSADDIVSPGAVKTAVEALTKNAHWDAVVGLTSRIDSQGRPYPYSLPFQSAPISFVIYFAHIPHCSFYVKRSALLDRQLLFNSTYKSVGDYEWMIRISRSTLKAGTLKQELSKVRIHHNQATQKHLDRGLTERQHVLEIYPVNKLGYWFLSSIYFFAFRCGKLALVFKSSGFKGVVDLIRKWYKIKFA